MVKGSLFANSCVLSASLAIGGLVQDVDPFWGCGAVANPPSKGMACGWNWLKAQTGNTHPGAVMPFGWVSACAYSGNYSSGYGRWGFSSSGKPPLVDEHLRAYGFTHFHNSGVGNIGAFYNYFLFVPSVSDADTTKPSLLTNEIAHPGYYAGTLADYGASFELTARPFASCHRYRFPSGMGRIRIELTQCGLRPKSMDADYSECIDSYDVRSSSSNVWAGVVCARGIDICFAILANGACRPGCCRDGIIDIPVCGSMADTTIGFSLSSVDEALARAKEAERVGFDASRIQASSAWESALGCVHAEFTNERERMRFYSALYHSLVKPMDCGTEFLDYSTIWDVYKTQLPFVLSTQSQVARRMMEDMLRVIERIGYFPLAQMMDAKKCRNNGQAAALSVYTLSDAFFRGVLTSADYPRLKAAFRSELSGVATKGNSPTYVLDVAGACWAASCVAESCGDHPFAEELRKRSALWKTVYDGKTGYLVEKARYYEGNFRNYSFRAHVGMKERIAMAGGVERFTAMLDDFFCIAYGFEGSAPHEERVRRPGCFEGLNNECDMESPYAYLWCGRPDRLAEVIDAVRRFRFCDGEGGCPGNNDSGGTSAWYVWSCLGLYPQTGSPYYLIGSPSVNSAEIGFSKGILRIRTIRESPTSIYPLEYSFNGRTFKMAWLSIGELESGGDLTIRLSDRPGTSKVNIPDWF